ncbi:sodium-dependent transporter [Salicola sp. Rm-C-2C1-2]|uniref:sodium-dependent transporter n=1 Tax=Salicola sp. Rm-C-2C1-2 TaxID=3141321 RepID=UPI0032E4A073
MNEKRSSVHGEWSSGLIFILAATGSAVGLGNLWRFPYLVGENGGSAFVLLYLACILLVGMPIMIAEVTLGRKGRRSPINSLRLIARDEGVSQQWALVGWMGVVAGVLILSFYSVVGGWSLFYGFEALKGSFVGISSDEATGLFEGLVADGPTVLLWHTLFMVILFSIVAAGVKKGLQRAVTLLMPLLFFLLLGLVVYGMTTEGFGEAITFLATPDLSVIDGGVFLAALGQAFFTLSLGMGAIMVYGAYLPQQNSIPVSSGWIVGMDTLTALLAGLAIFPIVFSVGLEPGEGPGLVFVTLPIVFGEIPLGTLLGIVFFILLSVAAITSGMSLLEPAVAYLTESFGGSRVKSAATMAVLIWLVGAACGLSLNAWSDITLWPGKNIFDSLDHVASNILLPLGGLFVAFFVGWKIRTNTVAAELDTHNHHYLFLLWLWATRVIAPAAVIFIFLNATGLLALISG